MRADRRQQGESDHVRRTDDDRDQHDAAEGEPVGDARVLSLVSLVRVVAALTIDLKTPALSSTAHSAATATSSTMNMHSEKVSEIRSTDSGPRCEIFSRARRAIDARAAAGAGDGAAGGGPVEAPAR